MKLLMILILLSSSQFVAAQQVPPPPPAEMETRDSVGAFSKVEIEARFPGGDSAWRRYIEENFNVEPVSDSVWKYLPANKKKKEVVMTAIVKFIVCKDGSLCEITTINKVPPAFKAEAERLIAESKVWEPAIQEGRKVKAYRVQPITLIIPVE